MLYLTVKGASGKVLYWNGNAFQNGKQNAVFVSQSTVRMVKLLFPTRDIRVIKSKVSN